HLLDPEVGRWQKMQLDVTINLHRTPDDAPCLVLEDAAVAVPVDEMGHGEQRTDDRDDKDGNGNKQVVHWAVPHMNVVGLTASARSGLSIACGKCGERAHDRGCVKARAGRAPP